MRQLLLAFAVAAVPASAFAQQGVGNGCIPFDTVPNGYIPFDTVPYGYVLMDGWSSGGYMPSSFAGHGSQIRDNRKILVGVINVSGDSGSAVVITSYSGHGAQIPSRVGCGRRLVSGAGVKPVIGVSNKDWSSGGFVPQGSWTSAYRCTDSCNGDSGGPLYRMIDTTGGQSGGPVFVAPCGSDTVIRCAPRRTWSQPRASSSLSQL